MSRFESTETFIKRAGNRVYWCDLGSIGAQFNLPTQEALV